MAHRDVRFRPWVAWVLLVPLALVTALWAVPKLARPANAGDKEEETKPVAVSLTAADLAPVTGQAVPVTVQATGTLEPLPGGKATIAAELPGRLLDLSLKPGDPVEAGQTIARVLRTDLDADIQKADADAAQARRDVEVLQSQQPLQAGTL